MRLRKFNRFCFMIAVFLASGALGVNHALAMSSANDLPKPTELIVLFHGDQPGFVSVENIIGAVKGKEDGKFNVELFNRLGNPTAARYLIAPVAVPYVSSDLLAPPPADTINVSVFG